MEGVVTGTAGDGVRPSVQADLGDTRGKKSGGVRSETGNRITGSGRRSVTTKPDSVDNQNDTNKKSAEEVQPPGRLAGHEVHLVSARASDQPKKKRIVFRELAS